MGVVKYGIKWLYTVGAALLQSKTNGYVDNQRHAVLVD